MRGLASIASVGVRAVQVTSQTESHFPLSLTVLDFITVFTRMSLLDFGKFWRILGLGSISTVLEMTNILGGQGRVKGIG